MSNIIIQKYMYTIVQKFGVSQIGQLIKNTIQTVILLLCIIK